MLKTVDIYRFDDGWRWVRVVGPESVCLEREWWSQFVKGTSWLDNWKGIGLDLNHKDKYTYLMLMSPDGIEAVLVGTLGDVSVTGVRSPPVVVGEEIFDLTVYAPGEAQNLLGRIWPLATEITADVNTVAYSMADGAIELPQVLPDRVWERMEAVESQISTPEEAHKALEYAFEGLTEAYWTMGQYHRGQWWPGTEAKYPHVELDPPHLVDISIVFQPESPATERGWAVFDGTTHAWMGDGPTFAKAMNQAKPQGGGPILRKSELDAMWDQIVVPGEGTLNPEPYRLLDAPHPAFLPLDTFVALARDEGLL